jgi:enhancing lycopene biosynthesis protein 2
MEEYHMKKKIGVILSGCGVRDGSEIHEAVFALLAIDKQGAEAVCMAPDMEFAEVNHLTMQKTGATRNVLQEAARIARGNIRNIKDIKGGELDAVILPGGFGAAINLCNCAEKGADATVHPEVARLLKEMASAGKPIGAICIAPALVAVVLGKEFGPKLTIGNDPATAGEINRTGSRHVECPVTEFVVDREHKIVSTPAYMLAERISETAEGIDKLVREVISLI